MGGWPPEGWAGPPRGRASTVSKECRSTVSNECDEARLFYYGQRTPAWGPGLLTCAEPGEPRLSPALTAPRTAYAGFAADRV